jgi:hypothetical protein
MGGFWTRSNDVEIDLAVTDDPVPLVAVSRSGVSCSGLQAAYGPEELLSSWHRN